MKLNAKYKSMKLVPYIALLVCFFLSGCATSSEVTLATDGYKAVMRGDRDEAIAIYTKLISMNPTNGYYYGSRAIMLYQIGDYDRAIADYNKAIKLYRRVIDIISAYKQRGQSWFKKGQYENALSDYNKALAQDFSKVSRASQRELSQGIYVQRSLIYEKIGRFEKAKEDAEKAYDIAPGNREAQERKESIYKILQKERAVSGRSDDRLSLRIENVFVKPAVVSPGSIFDLVVEHYLSDPSARTDSVHVTLTYRIVAGQKILYRSKPKKVKSANNKKTFSTIHLNASRNSGRYKIEVRMEYKDMIRGQIVDFMIK